MNWSTIFRTIRHFYFNCHYDESFVSYIHSSFVRRSQFALRMGITFIIGSYIAYNTSLNAQLSQEFLIPLISVLSIQETFGLTLAACFQMILSLVPTTIFLFIVQKIGLGYHNYLAAELVLLISSFVISFICTRSQTRKIPLVMCAIFFATIVNQPKIPSTFIFQLLEEFVVGMCIALLTSLTVFPIFATIDIENRVNYCLKNLDEMQNLIIKGFLHDDEMSSKVSLSRSLTIEQMIRVTISPLHMKFIEAKFEPSRLLQKIFNRKRRNIIDLTITEQEELIMCWFINIRSMQSMLKQCKYNDYHKDLIQEVEESILNICSCQSKIISTITKDSNISKDEFISYIGDLEQAAQSLRLSYNQARFHRVQDAIESAITIRLEDHLSHAFFIFQIEIIIQIFTKLIKDNASKVLPIKKKKSLKERLKPKWSHLFSALKSTIIIGVGSIFVMVPRLAAAFENGQWIFVALCMTQGDSVGGAFTTMKMRLLGTLLGAMWAYITYIAVQDNVYQTFGMLVPWILVFGYLRPSPKWSYTATVGTITPILINLGRIPYGNALPAGNFALLRIEENLVGIGVAIILTLIIFPVFAFDLLKDNIQSTFETCRDSIYSIGLIHNQFSYSEQLNEINIQINKQEENFKSLFENKRNEIYQMIMNQRSLIEHASNEPSLYWFNNNFSSNHYKLLIQEEIDIFQILFSIDTTMMYLHQYTINNEKQIENNEITSISGQVLTKVHKELSSLCNQLSDCFSLWSSYFGQSQTKFHRFFSHCMCSRKKLSENDLFKHEEYLIELHKTVVRLEKEHQNAVHEILNDYLHRLTEGYTPTYFLPYENNNEIDLILIAISSIYFSINQLARTAVDLGTNIHNIFELETTHRFVNY